MNRITENELVLYYYNELPEEHRTDLEQALETDYELRRQYSKLCQVLNTVSETETVTPDADFEARVWSAVKDRVKFKKPNPLGRFWQWFRKPVWHQAPGGLSPLVATLATVALIASFFAGRNIDTDRELQIAETQLENTATPFSAAARQRILTVSVSEHLDRTSRLFQQVTNIDATDDSVMISEQEFASALLGSNRIYRAAAERAGETRIVHMLDLMEPILLELAHRPQSDNDGDRTALQHRIEDNDLLFKVRATRAILNKPESI